MICSQDKYITKYKDRSMYEREAKINKEKIISKTGGMVIYNP